MSATHESDPTGSATPQDLPPMPGKVLAYWLVQFNAHVVRRERLNVGIVVAVPLGRQAGVYVTVVMPGEPELDRVRQAFPDLSIASDLAKMQCRSIKSRVLRDPYATFTVFGAVDEVVAHMQDVAGNLANETRLLGHFTRQLRGEEDDWTWPDIAKMMFDTHVKAPVAPLGPMAPQTPVR